MGQLARGQKTQLFGPVETRFLGIRWNMQTASILILESDRQLRASLVEIFRHYGFKAWGCSREMLANRFLKRFHPDFLIADITLTDPHRMPSLMTEWHTASPQTRVILESSFQDADLLNRAVAAGALALIVKPFLIGHVLQMIQRHS